ncbi:cupredoxin domain-containing protein [Chloroflexus sp.]|uniref:cupredoxin domain-containing protein n=1 Tax=Chloroflexus sp. TaxID=1904827 RepID=UPI002633ED59|nr:cupredoxin domain-containing protein [uncultured Chloroflexus sp.]
MRKIWLLLIVIALMVVPLTACSRRPTPVTEIDMVLTDYVFEPKEMIIPPGQTITLNITNKGAVVHEFVIMKYGTTIGESFGDEDEENIYWEVEVEPGQTMTVTFTSPEQPGQYQFVCGIEGHYTAGMAGTLQVVTP